jgi:coenzyme F420-reducing hydrogenase beta subunit
MTIKKLVTTIMQEKKLTPAQLAACLGCSVQAVRLMAGITPKAKPPQSLSLAVIVGLRSVSGWSSKKVIDMASEAE